MFTFFYFRLKPRQKCRSDQTQVTLSFSLTRKIVQKFTKKLAKPRLYANQNYLYLAQTIVQA